MDELKTLRCVLRERPRSLLLATIAERAEVPLPWLKGFNAGRFGIRETPNTIKLARYFAERDA